MATKEFTISLNDETGAWEVFYNNERVSERLEWNILHADMGRVEEIAHYEIIDMLRDKQTSLPSL